MPILKHMRKLFKIGVVSILALTLQPLVSRGGVWDDLKEKTKEISNKLTNPSTKNSTHQDGSGLQVLSVSPSGHVQDTGETIAVTVTFDRPMVALEALPPEEKPGPLILDPPLKGKYRWLGTNTLVFTPETPLAKATPYTATVPAGTKAHDGTELVGGHSWSFETVRPELVTSLPYHGSSFLDLKEPLFLVFNQEMSPERMKDFVVLKGKPTPANDLFGTIPPYVESDYSREFPVKLRAATDQEFEKIKWYVAKQNKEYCVVAVPSRELEREHSYTLMLKGGLPAKAGSLGLLQEKYFQFKTYNNFRVMAVQDPIHPQEGMKILFSNPLAGKDLAKALKINPSVKLPDYFIDQTYQQYDFVLSVELKPQQVYDLTIDGNLKDKFDQKLKDTWKGKVQVTSFVPYLSMPDGTVTIEGKLDKRLPVTVMNVKSIEKLVYPSTTDEAISLLLQPYGLSNNQKWLSLKEDEPQTWEIKTALDKSAVLPLELKGYLNEKGYGFLFANMRMKEPDPRTGPYPLSFLQRPIHKAFIQVTNLGVTAKCSPESNLIWVTYLHTGQPVIEANVELRNDASEVLWQGKTNKDGLVVSPGWVFLGAGKRAAADSAGEWMEGSYYKNPRVWIIASKGSDKAMVASNWGTGIYPWNFGIAYESYQRYPEYAGHVYTERGLYRAGETVYIKGLFRRKKTGDWIIADLKEVDLSIKNSRDEEILKTKLPVNEFGSFHTELALDPNAVTGHYSIEVKDPKLGEKDAQEQKPSRDENRLKVYSSFQVEAFVPAKFEVTTKFSKESFLYGEKAEGLVRGWYLFGAPMKDASVSWRAHLWEGGFTPEGHPGYSFGPRRYLGQYKGDYEGQVQVASGEEKLNEQGELSMSVPLTAPTLLGALTLQLEGTVTDEDRQYLSGRKVAIVHPGDYYVGIKPFTSFIDSGKPLDVFLITTEPDGKMVEGKAVELQVIKREWNSVRKAGVGGRTSWVSEMKDTPVKNFKVITKKDPVSVPFTPERSGYYILHASSRDSKGRILYADSYFYATGEDYVAWERGDDDRIELISDQTSYKPGQTAKVMVKSPFEQAFALVSLEREGILHQFTTSLKGSADVVTIPLDERYVPNVFVSVVLIQGRTADKKFSEKGEDLGKPAFKIGYVDLPVDPGTRHLEVKVSSDKKEYRPKGKTKVELQVKDAKGKPRIAECSVAVVDRGILDLIGYQTPDSFNSFYGQRPLSIETVESRLHVLGQRNYGEKGENRGGAGLQAKGLLSEVDLRSLFKATAYWKADLVTDANGKAVVFFDLPDNLTAFKIMVTAHTKDSRFGAGDAEFRVKKPLMLKPSLPRFARRDDKFQAGVVVHNQTGKKGKVLVEASAEGMSLLGKKTQEVLLDSGSSQEVKFDFVASKLGTAVLHFAAKLGGETDGLEWKIPVILPRMTEAVALYEQTDSTAKQPVKIPDNIYPEAGGLQVEAASTALIGLKEGIKYLEEYPYECLEQKISRVLPFLLANDVLEAFKISELKGEPRKKVVEETIQGVAQCQLSDGGFTYWPGGDLSCEYISAYALYFLYQARTAGFAVDQKMIDRGLNYLQNVLRRDDKAIWNYPYRRNGRLCTKAFIVYDLSLWGKPEPAYVNRLYEERLQIPLFGRTLLLKAVHQGKMEKSMEDELVRDLFNSIKIDPTKAHFEEQDPLGLDWIFDSSVRTTAHVLQAMLETDHDFPQAPKVIRWLMDERKIGRWRSTQENIYVFHAFSEYFRRYESQKPNFTATVTLGAKEALSHLFEGRSVDAVTKSVPWKDLPAGKEITATMSKKGTGRFYYGLRMIYAPKGILPAREEGLKVERTITLANGDALPKVIKAGTKLLVKLTVTAPFDRTYVAVEDSLPAGFQPVNTSFQTASGEDIKTLSRADDEDQDYKWWGTFNHREFYDDRVLVFADYLEQGNHTVRYLVNAITPGSFSLPPAKAEGMYTPEVFGRTSGGTIEVR